MRIAVTGADGQLGHELVRQLGSDAVPLLEHQMDLRRRESVIETIHDLRPTAVINAAAYTDVDGAESAPDLCRAINVDGTRHLAEVCRMLECPLVQISTDYVFGRDNVRRTPYRESDSPGPLGIYGRSKLDSEQQASEWSQHLIVRTCGLYVSRQTLPIPRNFPNTMLRLAETQSVVRVVDDQHCTPSYVPHVVAAIIDLVRREARGIFHVVNAGETTWYGFASELFRQAGIETPVQPIDSAEYKTAAKRPGYSVLDTTKYFDLGGPELPDWRTGIARFLAEGSRRPLDDSESPAE